MSVHSGLPERTLPRHGAPHGQHLLPGARTDGHAVSHGRRPQRGRTGRACLTVGCNGRRDADAGLQFPIRVVETGRPRKRSADVGVTPTTAIKRADWPSATRAFRFP